jgi:hypothetical protein
MNPCICATSALVTRETSDGFELSTGATLEVLASNFRNIRGRSVACCVMDEVGFWRSELTATPDTEAYSALMPSLMTIPNSMLVAISTPYRRSGLLYQMWKDHFGKDDDDILVVHAASRVFNPTLDQRVIDAALKRDPAAARSEWLAEWRVGLLGARDVVGQRRHRDRAVWSARWPRSGPAHFRTPALGRSAMVALARRHRSVTVDDWDDDLYEAKYYPRRVFKDGKGLNVRLALTDSAPRRFALMDARAREHQRLLDSYRLSDRQAAAHRPHEATLSLSDADIRAARSRSEHVREQWIRRMQDQWSEPIGGLPRKPPNGTGNGDDGDDGNGDDDNDPRSASERARDRAAEPRMERAMARRGV